MAFNLEKFFIDVFAPQKDEVVTVMYDLPHENITDKPAWLERRKMAKAWHKIITGFAKRYDLTVNPPLSYLATGANNANIPEFGILNNQKTRLEDVISKSTIVIVMPQYSATAPLFILTKKYKKLRVGSMPGVAKFMEETGLSADYKKIAETCRHLAPHFSKATGVAVEFSTGHHCHFDLSNHNHIGCDNGCLWPRSDSGTEEALHNLPSGEVYTVPNEAVTSKTHGELPVMVKGELMVFAVENNRIINVIGDSPLAAQFKIDFRSEPAMTNIAEVAIGCNDKAKVTGVILEDEKAGFHWAYGRSEHLGGTTGPEQFLSPSRICHVDYVYAVGCPIVCKKFEFIFEDGSRKTAIKDGVLLV